MKICSKCNKNKSKQEFPKQSKCKDGLNYWCKSCYKEYRDDNKDRIKSINALWQRNNPEKCNANTSKWAKNNLKKCAEKAKRWRNNNPDKAKEIDKRSRLKNPEKYEFYRKRWQSNNKDRLLIHWRNRNARKKNSEGKYNLEDIKKLLEYQKYKCVNCYKSVKKSYHVDHINPLSKGGTNWPENLQILCPTCNLRKNAKDPLVWAQENGRLL